MCHPVCTTYKVIYPCRLLFLKIYLPLPTFNLILFCEIMLFLYLQGTKCFNLDSLSSTFSALDFTSGKWRLLDDRCSTFPWMIVLLRYLQLSWTRRTWTFSTTCHNPFFLFHMTPPSGNKSLIVACCLPTWSSVKKRVTCLGPPD